MFVLGHSMGAGIATTYAVTYQPELAGLVLSGGGIAAPPGSTPPPPRTGAGDLASTLSRDPAVIEAYRDDPLVYHGPPPEPRAGALAAPRTQLAERVPSIALAS